VARREREETSTIRKRGLCSPSNYSATSTKRDLRKNTSAINSLAYHCDNARALETKTDYSLVKCPLFTYTLEHFKTYCRKKKERKDACARQSEPPASSCFSPSPYSDFSDFSDFHGPFSPFSSDEFESSSDPPALRRVESFRIDRGNEGGDRGVFRSSATPFATQGSHSPKSKGCARIRGVNRRRN